MEGLKLIAQSTFDKQQKFRPSAGPGTTGEAAYRYNVIEIGAFGGSSSSSATNAAAAAKRQSVGYGQNLSGVVRQNGSSKISLNEWMVFEDDLCSFMKKRPIDYVPAATAPSASFGGELEKAKTGIQTNTTISSGPSAPSRSASMHSSKITANSTTAATAAAATTTTTTVTSSSSDRNRKDRAKEEIEAVASLKLVCIPRAGVDNAGNPDTDSNTLAIGRETFLRLYVDHMDADHCALYYVAREYDGYHEFTDTPKGVVTKFIGTSEYALIWTFNRRTLETRGLFLDRCQRWRSSDSNSAAAAAATNLANDVNSTTPVTPIRKFFGGGQATADVGSSPSSSTTTPNKRWTKRQTGTVSASETWSSFRETLNIYRKYIFAPQVLSFVCCVQMLRAFDDQASEEDLPRLKEVEAGMADLAAGGGGGGGGAGVASNVSIDGTNGLSEPPDPIINNHTQTTATSSFALITDHNPFSPSTPPPPPRDDEKLIIPTSSTPSQQQAPNGLLREKLVSQNITINRIDTSLANKLRHLKMAKAILEVIARENETLTVDVVASNFLDRYHWAMEGMNEAIPALERHISCLEEYLRYLKGRSERLSGLVRSLIISVVNICSLLSATNTTTTTTTTTTNINPTNTTFTSRTQSDALSLRCNEADSRSSDRSFGRPGGAPHNISGGGRGGGDGGGGGRRIFAGAAMPARRDVVHHDVYQSRHHRREEEEEEQNRREDGSRRDQQQRQQQQQGRGRLHVPYIGFYASYLLRGNYSHRLA